MGLSTSELLLIIRARDEATRTLSKFAMTLNTAQRQQLNQSLALGTALTSVGATMTAVGVGVIRKLDEMGDAYNEYYQAAATSLTQVEDKVDTSMDRILQMGLDTASQFAVNFKEIQPAIYDIFSSIDVNGTQAKIVLDGIAKAAIGGATDMETAGSSIIGIMNAWGFAAEDVGHINDQMFQLVRKGRGTFQQFTAAMGKAIPSAKNASQNIEEVSAMMMLMTRAGVSTAMSGTAAARAMDLLANPQFQVNMKAAGMSVYDASGKMKPMSAVIEEIRQKFKDLNPEQRANELKGLLGGAGNNIQARRFLNLALGETNGLYKQMLIYAKDAGGAADEAYNIMKDTPEAKLQHMANEWEVFKVGIGEAVSNVKVFLSQAITPLLEAFNKLSPEVKRNLTIITMVGAAFLVLSGVIIGIIGAVMLISATFAALGVGLAGVLAPVGAVLVAVGALAAVGYLLYANWDAVVVWWNGVWAEMQRVIQPFLDKFQIGLQFLIDGWNSFMENIQPGIDALVGAFQKFSGAVGPILNWIVGMILSFFIPAWEMISSVVGGVLGGLGRMLSGLMQIISGVINFISALFTGDFAGMGQALLQILGGIWQTIVGVFQSAIGVVLGVIRGFIWGIIGFFTYLWDVLVGHSIVPDMINAIIRWFQSLPGKAIGFVVSLVSGVVSWFAGLWGKIWGAISGIAGSLGNAAKDWFNRMKSAVVTGIGIVIGFVKGIPGKVTSAIGNVGSILSGAGSSIINGLWNGMKSMWESAKSWITGIADWIQQHKGPLSYDLKLLQPAGKAIMMGFNLALLAGWVQTQRIIRSMNTELAYAGPMYNGSNSYLLNSGMSQPGTNNQIDITVNTQEIDPVKNSADLGYELAARLNL